MSRITFVLGGARSGKSTYAAQLADELADKRAVVFVATATALDEEMGKRIARHRAERPAHWTTIEEPYDIGAAIWSGAGASSVVLIDCLTLLVSNHLMLHSAADSSMVEANIDQVMADMIVAAKEASAEVIIVSNEVGLGIVPEYPLARRFRDVAGRANQRVAAAADRVVFMVAGIPTVIKG